MMLCRHHGHSTVVDGKSPLRVDCAVEPDHG